jgi:glycine oxidase
MSKPDLLIVGGGVIGLGIADCARREGLSVCILDKGPLGQEASWAGAGMLTCRPMPRRHAGADYHDLSLLSCKLHAKWAERLRAETGIDTGYRVSGALELFFPENKTATLQSEMQTLVDAALERGLRARIISAADLLALEPNLRREVIGGIEYRDEAQVRNPWFLRALIASVKNKGAEIREGVAVKDVRIDHSRVLGIELQNGERLDAGAVVICAGAWSGQFPSVTKLAPVVGKIFPVRGQILCYQAEASLTRHMLTCDHQYIVPRGDGVVLVGATKENAGFEKTTTEEGASALKSFAENLIPAFKKLRHVKQWAGLRPGLKGRHPIIGPVPETTNLYVASGHFRNGLTLAPATAELLMNVILKRNAQFSVEAWYPAAVSNSGR